MESASVKARTDKIGYALLKRNNPPLMIDNPDIVKRTTKGFAFPVRFDLSDDWTAGFPLN